MPSYSYACQECPNVIEIVASIGTARRQQRCDCGGMARLQIGVGVQIAPSALENKGASAREGIARDRRWNVDMPAYKRMRKEGMQPAQIDGSASLEDRVGDQFDIHYKSILDKGVTRERIVEAREQIAELTEA